MQYYVKIYFFIGEVIRKLISQEKKIYLRRAKLQIALKIWGNETDPVVLALHGWLDNAASFNPMAPYCQGLQLITIDMPGHGLSDHLPPGVSYHFSDQVAYLHEIYETLGLAKARLLGHSMGASVVSLFAGTFPEKVTKLAMIEGLGPLAATASETPERLKRSILASLALDAKKLPLYPNPQAATTIRQQVGKMKTESAASLISRGLKAVDGGYTWCTDQRLMAPSPVRLTEAQIQAFFGNIACPTLFIKARSGILKKGQLNVAHREAWVQGMKVVELEGGHHLHMDDPESVGRVVRNFLCENPV